MLVIVLKHGGIACIMTVSFAWTVLLFVELYLRWTISDGLQRECALQYATR